MIGRERERERERDNYERLIADTAAERDRAYTGTMVVRADQTPWVNTRQGPVKYYLWPSRHSDGPVTTALDDWSVFVLDVRVHSGKHRHQGGLVIFILEGEGYSIVEGERHDWEAGDLLLLPLRPGGVEHQHFNRYPDRPAKWIAFISNPVFQWGATEMVQVENHPEYDAWQRSQRRQ